jgi:hypothetical protein
MKQIERRRRMKVYLDLLWLDYLDIVKEANDILLSGNKLAALGLAIEAHKAKTKYENEFQKYILSPHDTSAIS